MVNGFPLKSFSHLIFSCTELCSHCPWDVFFFLMWGQTYPNIIRSSHSNSGTSTDTRSSLKYYSFKWTFTCRVELDRVKSQLTSYWLASMRDAASKLLQSRTINQGKDYETFSCNFKMHFYWEWIIKCDWSRFSCVWHFLCGSFGLAISPATVPFLLQFLTR